MRTSLPKGKIAVRSEREVISEIHLFNLKTMGA